MDGKEFLAVGGLVARRGGKQSTVGWEESVREILTGCRNRGGNSLFPLTRCKNNNKNIEYIH